MTTNILKKWLPLAFLATVFAGVVYGTVQQSYRQSANDPQVQLAEDAAMALAAGNPLPVNLSQAVDIGKSLAPYLVAYDESGKPIGGNGALNGALPNLPPGVFDYARAWGEDRFTWQPNPEVRNAVVVVKVNGGAGGFVMAGRSLREIEIREGRLTVMVGAAWAVAIIGTLAFVAFLK